MARPVERSTHDLVVIGLTILVIFVVAVEVVGSVLIVLIRPDVDVDPIFRALTEVMTVIVGALIGFIGGRAVGRREGP